jgi:hypothetical protein
MPEELKKPDTALYDFRITWLDKHNKRQVKFVATQGYDDLFESFSEQFNCVKTAAGNGIVIRLPQYSSNLKITHELPIMEDEAEKWDGDLPNDFMHPPCILTGGNYLITEDDSTEVIDRTSNPNKTHTTRDSIVDKSIYGVNVFNVSKDAVLTDNNNTIVRRL